MDLDGFTKLNDAQIKAAESQADIAGKLASAEVTWQQAVKGALENLAKYLDIAWDAQAHQHLLRTRDIALQRARELRREAETLRRHLGRVTWLFSGGEWETVRDAWVSFEYLRHHLPAGVVLKAASVVPDDSAYSRDSWLHPTHGLPEMPQSKDANTLLTWARQHTCYPKWGTLAYTLLAQMLHALSDAAVVEATAIRTEYEAANKDALELEQRDWDRLKQNA